MCNELLFSILFVNVVYHLYEDFLTIPTSVINDIFTQKVVNFHPVKGGFFLGSSLGTTTGFTRKTSHNFYGHKT